MLNKREMVDNAEIKALDAEMKKEVQYIYESINDREEC